jgi:glycosyltransferase involved in cell wall biosynthesis
VTTELNALLVQSGDAAALAGAIDRMATDPKLRERLGEAARVRSADFSVEGLVKATASLYLRLAGRAGWIETA